MNKKDESNPKRFMFRKKRVKQPSTLKKQILKERLRLHEQTLTIDEAVVEVENVSTVSNEIFVFGLIDEETNLQDSDELAEIINNVKELFGEYGLLLTVDIAVTKTSDGSSIAVVIITYSTTDEAQTAAKVTDKLVLGGSTIRVLLHPSISLASTSSLDSEQPAVDAEASSKADAQYPTSQIAYNLLLWNIISVDDLESSDAIEESLQDILSLCRPCKHKPKVELIRYPSPTNTSSQQLLTLYQNQLQLEYDAKQALKKKSKFKPMSSSLPPLVIIETGHIINTLLLGSKLHGLQIGGEVLQSRYFISFSGSEDIVHFSFAAEEEENKTFGLQISHPEIPVDILLTRLQEAGILVANMLSAVPQLGSNGIIVSCTTLLNLLSLYQSVIIHDPSLVISIVVKTSGESDMKIVSQMTLGIQGYLTTTDLQDSDEEEVLTAKQDLIQIMHDLQQSSESDVERAAEDDIQRLYVLTTSNSHGDSATSADHEDSDCNDAVIQVGLASLEDAQCNMVYFEGLVLGGQRVTTRLVPATPTSTVESTMLIDDSANHAGEESAEDDEEMQRLYSLLTMPRTVLYHEDITAPPPPDASSATAAELSASYPARKISQYLLAKQAPKLGYHPTEHHLPIPHATEEINLILKEFLTLLSTFQLRLRESKKSALVFKQKQRFVTGIKQATNAVKAGKVKLLLIAPNTEAAEAIDEKISLLINTARVLNVPVLYALSKRLLGKALQMSMKQSVVAVFIPDGAYEQFRKVLAFLRPKD